MIVLLIMLNDKTRSMFVCLHARLFVRPSGRLILVQTTKNLKTKDNFLL